MSRVRIVCWAMTAVLSLATATGLVADEPMKKPGPSAKPQSRYPAGEVRVAGRAAGEILKMLGAKRVTGATDAQLRSYTSAFGGVDRDGDGRHSKKEYIENGRYMTLQARRGIFAAADNNADGFVTRVEYVLNRIITDEAKAILERSDGDNNGQVTRAEFVTGSAIADKVLAGAVYDALDASGDGVITPPEYLRVWGRWARPNYEAQEQALARRLTALGQGSNGQGRKSGRSEMGGRRGGGRPSVDQIFRIMDRNSDGKLTRAEFRGPARIFESADKDGNGVVTRAELEASRGRSGKPDAGRETRRGGHDRTRKTFTTPHALDPTIVKDGHNLVVDKDGREVVPQGRPIQSGYRLVLLERSVEDKDKRAYAQVFSIMAPIRDALIYRLEKTSPEQWKKLTAILENNQIKTKQWLEGATPKDNYYSSQGIFEHLRGRYAGKTSGTSLPGNTYAERDYRAMMKYLDEAELELKWLTFSSGFDFKHPAGVSPGAQRGKGLIK